jgi:hypothetical protein
MFKQIYGVLIGGISVTILGSVGFLIYSRIQNAEVSCEKVVTKFSTLISNPTDVITGNEKTILKSITQTGFIADIKSEQLILKIRKLSPNFTTQKNPINFINADQNYASSKIHFEAKGAKYKSFDITLQMENTRNFWLGDKCMIFKVETPSNFETIDETIKAIIENPLIDKAKQIKDEGVKIISETITNITNTQQK